MHTYMHERRRAPGQDCHALQAHRLDPVLGVCHSTAQQPEDAAVVEAVAAAGHQHDLGAQPGGGSSMTWGSSTTWAAA